jgi:hypothetical protein
MRGLLRGSCRLPPFPHFVRDLDRLTPALTTVPKAELVKALLVPDVDFDAGNHRTGSVGHRPF